MVCNSHIPSHYNCFWFFLIYCFRREKSHLDDLRSTNDSHEENMEGSYTLTVGGRHAGEEGGGRGGKKLTARERLRIKKMQEADKRAQDLK